MFATQEEPWTSQAACDVAIQRDVMRSIGGRHRNTVVLAPCTLRTRGRAARPAKRVKGTNGGIVSLRQSRLD